MRELSGASERKKSVEETNRTQNKWSKRVGNGCTRRADSRHSVSGSFSTAKPTKVEKTATTRLLEIKSGLPLNVNKHKLSKGVKLKELQGPKTSFSIDCEREREIELSRASHVKN